MIKEIENKVKESIALAEAHFRCNFGYPTVKYDVRGTTAGKAKRRTHEVNFNVAIYEENKDEFLNRTVPHEVAHRIAIMVYGEEKGKGHGPAWRHIMRLVYGLDPRRCHNYSVDHHKTRTIRKWKYSCGCEKRTFTITTVKHNRILKKPGAYVCKICGNSLKFVGEA